MREPTTLRCTDLPLRFGLPSMPIITLGRKGGRRSELGTGRASQRPGDPMFLPSCFVRVPNLYHVPDRPMIELDQTDSWPNTTTHEKRVLWTDMHLTTAPSTLLLTYTTPVAVIWHAECELHFRIVAGCRDRRAAVSLPELQGGTRPRTRGKAGASVRRARAVRTSAPATIGGDV